MGFNDVIVISFYIIIFSVAIYFISGKIERNIRKYFYLIFFVKLLVTISMAFVYIFYYKYGDTLIYFEMASEISGSFFEDFLKWLQIIFTDYILLNPYSLGKFFAYDSEELFIIKIISIFNLLSFDTYLGSSMFFLLINLYSSWLFFTLLIKRYPNMNSYLVFSVFFIPSTLFWCSGIMKENLVLSGFYFAFYGLTKIQQKRNILKGLIFTILGVWMFTNTRINMFELYVFPLAIVYFFKYSVRIKSFLVKSITLIMGVITLSLLFVFLFEDIITELENLAFTSQNSAEYLYSISKDGSRYSFSAQDGTVAGFLSLFPFAVWVTFFRPYIWEASNVFMFLVSIENLFLFILFIILLIKTKVIGIWFAIRNDNFLLYSILFSLLYAFIIGASTYNFGSLERYRSIMLPLFCVTVFIILNKNYNKKYI